MTDLQRFAYTPDPTPPLRSESPFGSTYTSPLSAILLAGVVGFSSACTNHVGDDDDIQLIESLANAAPDLADADDLVRVEGFDRELADGSPSDLTPCSGSEGCASLDDLAELEEIAADSDEIIFASGMTVDQAVWSVCSTSVLRALTDQLVSEIECMRPDTMDSIEGLTGITMGAGATPYLQTKAVERLDRARQIGGSIHLNSTLRSLAQQFLLYQWSQVGRCGIGLAARPGRSNHESGLAVDVNNWSSRRSAFQSAGWRWLGSRDPVHFDYLGSGTVSLQGLSVLAFQRLWNRNNPNDQISEDGDYGPQTASRLSATPTAGFDSGATCDAFGDGSLNALEVYWERLNDDSYDLRAVAPTAVTRVETFVDGFRIAVADRDDGANFPANYTFSNEETYRRMDVVGVDASGEAIAAGVGYLDVTADVSFSIKQLGENLFEVFVERAPADVAAINVSLDGTQVVDGISGRAPSPRMAVRTQINTLGARNFEIKLYDAEGALLDTITRVFDLSPRVPEGLGEPEPEPEPEAEPESEPDTSEPDVVVGEDLCNGVTTSGGVVSEEESCVTLGGPSQYLRSVNGDGHAGSFVWTGATSSTNGANFAQFNLDFDQAGTFLVEASIPASATSRTRSAEYFVRSQGSTKAVTIDQNAVDGFVGVGIFTFDAGENQFVSLYDNTGESSSQGRKVVFDAIRLTSTSQLTCTSATITAGTLNVRRQPNTNESAITQVSRNDVVQGLGVVQGASVSGNTDWMRIRKGSLTGFVSTSFLNCN